MIKIGAINSAKTAIINVGTSPIPIGFPKLGLSENKFKRPLISDLSDDQLTEYIAKHLFERSLFYDKATYKISIDNKEIQEIVTEIRILLH